MGQDETSDKPVNVKKWLIVIFVALFIGSFFGFGLHELITLDQLKTLRRELEAYVQSQPGLAGLQFFLMYILVAAVSLPGATVMTLAAGALFGLVWGLVLVSFASTIGASLAFVISRNLLRDWVGGKFSRQVSIINSGRVWRL